MKSALPTLAAVPPFAQAPRPMIGVAAVLLGAVTATLFGRITTFGLADIRGAVHAGVDEGAWITTAATVGQMFMGILSVWLGAAFGARRVLMWGTATFGMACILIPLAPDLRTLIALQTVAGMGSGTFIPLAIAFVMKNLKPDWQVYGVAAYALALEFSLNVPASLEGFYVEHWGWQWIFWQHGVLAPLLLSLISLGMPREAANRTFLDKADWPGMLYLGVGASLGYAALDQGDRLDWLGSGLITGLFAGATLLIAMFVLRELTTPAPFFHFGFAARGNLPLLAALLVLFRFLVLATALIVPQFLTIVQGYRALEAGDALLWIALPQLLLAPMVALILHHFDTRLVMSIGFAAIGFACLMVANGLTHDWVSADFVPSQLVQALGQSFGLTAFIWFATRHIDPAQALTFGAFLQTFRLFGGELGVGVMTWFIRAREQLHSNLIGLHVDAANHLTQARLAASAVALQARALGPADTQARAATLLSRAVQSQAYVLAFIDAMTLVALAAALGLALISLLRPAPIRGPSAGMIDSPKSDAVKSPGP